MEINRREFLKVLGIMTGGLATASCGYDPRWSVPDDLIKAAQRGPGIETWRNTLCSRCAGGCGIRVRLIDGIPVKIEGNPLYPINRGGICPQGAAGLDVLYNPDRVKNPLLRSGDRGSGRWIPISWDEAMNMVISKLNSLRKAGTPNKVAILKEGASILMEDIFSLFMKAYGSSNIIDTSDGEEKYLAFFITQGLKGSVGYDLSRAKYILNFGANLFEEGPSPVYYMKEFKELREQVGQRAKIIHISPRLSTTGMKAAEWLQIKPSTYGALAYSIAYVLIKENLYDRGFVAQHTSGFDEWKDYVLKEFYPSRTSQITGIPVEQILKISREFGYTKPALALCNHNASASSNGLFNVLAVHSLNALAGNFEKPGGILLADSIPLKELPELKLDGVAMVGLTKPAINNRQGNPVRLKSFKGFIENLLSSKPYELDTLFIYNSNPLFTYPYQKRIKKALERIPFMVSFSSFIDETTEYADLVLPDHTDMERWDLNPSVHTVTFPCLGIQMPVVEPFYDTKHTGDVLLAIASRISGISLPFKNSLELLKFRVEGIFKVGSGLLASEVFETSWEDFLRKRGWLGLRYGNFEEFLNTLVEVSGWWEPVYQYGEWKRVFKSKEGRFRFVFEVSGKDFLKTYRSPESKGEKDKFPLYLNIFEMLTNIRGKGANSPLLQEMFGFYHKRHWDSWVEINPKLAQRLRLEDGDLVEVESQVGKIRVAVKVYQGVMSEVINIPFGQGHTSYGRYARGIGVNPYSLVVENWDDISDLPALNDTMVRITKI